MKRISAFVIDMIRGRASSGIAPIFFAAPYIIGIPSSSPGFDQGVELNWDAFTWDSNITSYSTGSWGGTPPITVTQQWQLNGVDIPGETNDTYSPVAGDIGGTLTVTQILTNSIGIATSTSAGIVVVTGS
jgi:hypothetical protein